MPRGRVEWGEEAWDEMLSSCNMSMPSKETEKLQPERQEDYQENVSR